MESAENGSGRVEEEKMNIADVEVGIEPTSSQEPAEEQALVKSCIKCGESDQVLLSRCDKNVEIAKDVTPSSSASPPSQIDNEQSTTTCMSCVRPDRTPRYQRHNPRISATMKKNCSCRDYWGLMLSLTSGLASTFGGLIVKHMKDFHTFSLATYRFQGILLPTLIMLLYLRFVRKENVTRSIWPIKDKDKLMKFGFTFIRAVIGCLGLYLYFFAIKLIPLADAKVILSCRPVFVIFVAKIFLGEPCGIFPVVTSMLAILGVAIISRPPVLTGNGAFDSDTLMGTIFATLSMLAATLSMVVLRYLRGVHVGIVTLAFGFWGTLLSIACSATVERLDVPETRNDWILWVSSM